MSKYILNLYYLSSILINWCPLQLVQRIYYNKDSIHTFYSKAVYPRGGGTPFLGRFAIVVSSAGDHVQAIILDDITLKLKGITRSIEMEGIKPSKCSYPPLKR